MKRSSPLQSTPPLPFRPSRTASGWSLRIKFARVAWALFSPLFWPLWGRYASGARIWALRLFGARIGASCLVCGGVSVWMPWNLTMGDGSTLGPSVEVYNFARITIGQETTISQYSYLCSATHDYTLPDMPLRMHPITIGSGAWVCARSFIGPRVIIGDGTVIGAGSVVTRDMPPWTVCAGNPCRQLKPRVLQELQLLGGATPTALTDLSPLPVLQPDPVAVASEPWVHRLRPMPRSTAARRQPQRGATAPMGFQS
jgi:putative colanic acid biosynthesis acetyltransferase WcaF